MRKLLPLFFALTGFFFIFTSQVQAGEGRIKLVDGNVICEGISVWRDNRYQIFGRCSGMTYPYREKLDQYVLWIQPDDGSDPVSINYIDRGVLDGETDKNFTRIFITAEEQSGPSAPSSFRVVEGDLSRFDFTDDGSRVNTEFEDESDVFVPEPVSTVSAAPAFNFGRLLSIPVVIAVILVLIVIGILISFRR